MSKKAVYALCGTAMVIAATFFRLQFGGGVDIAGMSMTGLVLLAASIDAPVKR